MRLPSLALAACVVLFASLARAATPVALPPAPDVSGRGSGKSLGRAITKASGAAHVRLASTAELNRAAAAANVSLKSKLTLAQAAKLASRGGFSGVVLFRNASSGAFAQFIDPLGQVVRGVLNHVR